MKKLAIVRGKFLNAYEMQIFEPLVSKYDITGFGSLSAYHDSFSFSVEKLPSPMDLPEFPYKMQILNRVCTDAHYLFGLEEKLKGFDIVHTAETYFRYTQQSLRAKKRGYVQKVVATVLENIPFNNEGIWGRKEYKRKSREELDHIIALTKRTKEALILEGANPEKISVVGHGIETKRFLPRKDWLRNEKNKKKFSILFSGRLEIYKGIYEVVYAAKLLLTDPELREYHLSFNVIGEGHEKEKLLSLERKLGIQKFIHHKSVAYHLMPGIYNSADLFWSPSKPTQTYQEQYCTALLEAQSAGLPIVTSLSGGIPENVDNAGILVGPGDVYSLKEAMKEYILNHEKRILFSQKARKRALEVHDVQIIADKLDKVYQKVLQK